MKLKTIQEFIIKYYLPIGFFIAVIISLSTPIPGLWLAKWKSGDYKIVEFICYCFVFLISGISLNIDSIKSISQHYIGFLYGFISILFLTTLLAYLLRIIPLSPPEYSIGFTIFATVPTTLGVGVALTHSSKGNVILSLLLTITTNLFGVITIPLMLNLYLNNSSITINITDLALKLCMNVLIPSIVGMFLRTKFKLISEFYLKYKTQFSLFSTSCLIIIVWMALSVSREILIHSNGIQIIFIILIATVMHLFYIFFNSIIVNYILHLNLPESISIIIMSSQKSSPVALAVISYIATDDDAGLYAVPCMIGQLLQIFIGSFIATYFATKMNEYEKNNLKQQMTSIQNEEKEEKRDKKEEDGEGKESIHDLEMIVVAANSYEEAKG